MANLIDSLQTSQDFLRRYSLRCVCLSNDGFAGMRFLHLRPMSMDAGREWQEDASSHNGWKKGWDTGEQTTLHHWFPEDCGKTPRGGHTSTPGFEDDRAVSPSRTW